MDLAFYYLKSNFKEPWQKLASFDIFLCFSEHHKSESEYNLYFFVPFLSAEICVLYSISNFFSIPHFMPGQNHL